jgi:hypothetical protein
MNIGEFKQAELVSLLNKIDFEDFGLKDWKSLYKLVELKQKDQNDVLQKLQKTMSIAEGTLVHLVVLDSEYKPSRPIKIVFNNILSESLKLESFNMLVDDSVEAPGSWFVREGYNVFSTRLDNKWVQVAIAIGYTNFESYIDYIDDVSATLTSRQKVLKKHVDSMLRYHQHDIAVHSENTIDEVKIPTITNFMKKSSL